MPVNNKFKRVWKDSQQIFSAYKLKKIQVLFIGIFQFIFDIQ